MNERRALVALTLVPGLGPARIRKLVEQFGSATALSDRSESSLGRITGIGQVLARAIASAGQSVEVDRQFERAARLDAELLTFWDADYPALLREIAVPPVILWTAGKKSWLSKPCVAVVGTRTPTEYGRVVASAFAHDLVGYGFCVVSGLALGIDSIAHRDSMRGGGDTIAVFGSGLDRVYPTRHRRLASAIGQHGALVSEFAMGAKPEAGNFPRRNRLIAGLSLGVVVVEARPTGGALGTARLGLDQNREVFAVPGRVDSSASAGCHALIRRGEAMLVTNARDVATALGREAAVPVDTPIKFESREQALVWSALGDDVKHVDDLCVETKLAVPVVLSVLLRWEFDGSVYKMPGARYRRSNRRR